MISEKNANTVFIPGFDGPLVSLSLFNELQHNILHNETVENAYKEYKSKYEAKKYQSFYVEHKDDEWFKEKYDPTISKKMKEERNVDSQRLADRFLREMPKNLSLKLREADEDSRNVKIIIYGYLNEREEFEERERDLIIGKENANSNLEVADAPYYGYDPDKLTLFLHQVPRNVSRSALSEVLRKLPGYVSMSFSEPMKNIYFRYCWVTFDNEDNLDLAYETLNDYRINNDFKLNCIKSKSGSQKKIRLTPTQFEERLEEDLELTWRFIQLYDKERNVNSDKLYENKDRSKEEQLDLQILFLRKVYGFCYYCLEEHEDERALSTKCDHIHLRPNKSLGKRTNDETSEAIWDRNFTRLAKEKIEKFGENSNISENANQELSNRRNQYFKDNTTSANSERFICNICSKVRNY